MVLSLATAISIGRGTEASAQVFLAKDPNPEFRVGPLFVNHTMPRDPGGIIQVNLSWSLTTPAGRTPPTSTVGCNDPALAHASGG